MCKHELKKIAYLVRYVHEQYEIQQINAIL